MAEMKNGTGGHGTVTVGTASAAPGTAVRGIIPVTELAGGTSLDIPVVVVNGANDGPCFWVNGAIHGDEPEGPLACQIALAEVDPTQLSGALVMCPVVNVQAFNVAERGNPGDTFTYDMNRIYPGRPDGYLSERVAAAHAAAMGPVADFEISLLPRQGDLRRREPGVGGVGHGDGPRVGLHHVELQPVGLPDGVHEADREGRHHRRARRSVGDLP